MDILTPSNITFAIGTISTIFAIFLYFKNPQDKLEKNQIRNEERDKNKATVLEAKEVENKAAAFLLASNHTNTVDTKVDKLIKSTNLMSNEITRLRTIIEERIPKK